MCLAFEVMYYKILFFVFVYTCINIVTSFTMTRKFLQKAQISNFH